MSFKSPMRLVPTIRARMDAVLGSQPQPYYQKVLSYSPIAYWPLWETAGVTAADLVNSPAQDGTYTGVTLANGTAPDGSPCPFFDGANDLVNVFTATLQSAFNGEEGTLMIWAQVANAGVWTDGQTRQALRFGVDANNRIYVLKEGANNTLTWHYRATAVDQVTQGGYSFVDMRQLLITWSRVADEMRAYLNGIQVGLTQTGLGAWAGALALAVIGSNTAIPSLQWHGWLAHCAVWDSPLSPAAILDLATV